MSDIPGYLANFEHYRLKKIADDLMDGLEDCMVCPHHCHVNRKAGEVGYCNARWSVEVSDYGSHLGEEPPLVGKHGSGTIFFNHCNLGCLFCQNWAISHGEGKEMTPRELGAAMLELERLGCHNINLVTPSHYVPQIIAAVAWAVSRGLHIPLVYNSSGYDDKYTLEKISGIIDIYMPDFKYADSTVGQRLSCIADYWDIATAAIKEMHRQVGDFETDKHGIARRGLMIRHLVLPDGLAGTEKVMNFIAAEISPYTYINLMNQYYPDFKAAGHSELGRVITKAEFKEAIRLARQASPHFRFAF